MFTKHTGKISDRSYILLICAALILATIFAFEPLRHNDFLNYDDFEYITANNYVQAGLTWQNVCWAFSSTVSNHWHPLTWLSHMFDCHFFGLNPFLHHLVNLTLHIINTLLLFLLLKYATSAMWQSAFVALLFALHPLHVESVVWAAERKDVLSTCFGMLTIMAYFWYVRRPGFLRYCIALMLFALGLMAKSMLVTFPAILLLLDFWPLERDIKSTSLSKIFLEKIPFFVLTFASAVITIVVMKHAGHVADTAQLSFKYRIANVFFSYVAYIYKMFWPTKLAPFYPHPGATLILWKAVIAAVVLLVISVLIIYWSRRRRYLLVGWLWYLITLSPVIGFLQIGSQAMADRYTYIPLVGLFIIISFAAYDLLQNIQHKKPVLIISAALITFALIVCTNQQVRLWRNSISLFEHTLKVTSNNYLAHNNLANALGQNQNYDAAIGHCLEAIRIRPKYYRAHYNLGMAFYHKGDMDKAVSHWTQVLQLKPDFAETNYNIAIALLKQNKTDKAIQHLEKEIELNPSHIRARKTLSELKNQLDEKNY